MSPLWGKRWPSVLIIATLMSPVGVAHSAATQAETCRAATTFATNLGLMRGHLLVAAELFEAGHIELAQRHSKHPAEEVYQELLPGLVQFGVPGFATELGAFADVLAAGEQGRELFSNHYVQLMQTMNAIEDRLPLGVRQQQHIAFALVSQAAVEYAVGVAEDGRVTDMQEYQDAYGFVTVAKGKVVDEAAVGTGNLTRAFTAALRLWPALMPQQPVAMESDDLTQLVVLMRQLGMAAPACD